MRSPQLYQSWLPGEAAVPPRMQHNSSGLGPEAEEEEEEEEGGGNW